MITMRSLHTKEAGVASITVTLIVMGIVTLIAVGFAALMRREQRQALDQQLSTQAFYAAESGVNAARQLIDTEVSAGRPIPNYSSCAPAAVIGSTLPGDLGASYTCVLIDSNPTSLDRSPLDTDKSWIIRVQGQTENIKSIKISWESSGSTHTFANNALSNTHLLPPASEWGNRVAILRSMIIDPGANVHHFFLYPNASNASPISVSAPTTTATQGDFMNGNCRASVPSGHPRRCNVTITGLDQPFYFVRLRAIYNAANVSITAYGDDNNTPLELINGQAEIDVTGKATDVLKRIKVKVPLENRNVFPEYALEAFDTICKRFTTRPGGARADLDASWSLTASERTELEETCDPGEP